MDGDGAAAMRYTEARLSRIGQAMLNDIDKNTVDMKDNFDGTLKEPSVLSTFFPNALANGVEGIAVGMTTKMAPHNLTEIYDTLIYIIESVQRGEEPEEHELLKRLKGPDFPLGGQIIGIDGILDAFRTGKGKIVIRSKYEVVETKKGIEIVVTEIPYKVNKASIVDKIVQLSKKSITDIKNVEDQSNKEGIRIVIELKKDSNVDLVLNRLFKSGCGLQKTYSINNTVVQDGVPQTVSTLQLLEIFFSHSVEILTRRTQFDYDKAYIRFGIVEAIIWVLSEKLEEVIELIRTSKSQEEAMLTLKALYEASNEDDVLSDDEAKAIIDMKLRQLTEDNLERYMDESEKLAAIIDEYNSILTDQNVLLDKLKDIYIKMRDEFGDERRTEIVLSSSEIREEDIIEDETLILTYTSDAIIKTVPESEYQTTNRGAKGMKLGPIKEDESIMYMKTVNSKDQIVFFSSLGKCYVLRAFQIQKTTRTGRGKSIYNYLPLQENEQIVSLVNIQPKAEGTFTLVTKYGAGKRLAVESLPQISTGAKAISFKEGDELIAAIFGKNEDNIIVATKKGISISFEANNVRIMGRTASGVKVIDLQEDDYVVYASTLEPDKTILSITNLGLGKRTKASEFTIQQRGGKGIRLHKLNDKTGDLSFASSVSEDQEVLIATTYGKIVRVRISDIPITGRATSGVKTISLSNGDEIASVSIVNKEEEKEQDVQQ